MSQKRARAAKEPAQKAGYHHQALRRALLDAAIVHLAKGDVTNLTMVTLARAAGVSPGAPYHHFADKLEVVAALATEGFSIWLERAEHAVAAAASVEERLLALARAWLRFAEAHPAHYRVMFLPDVEDRDRFSELHATSGRGLELLLGVVAELLPEANATEVRARAVAVWSALHGFASLRNAGVLTNIPGLPGVARLEDALLDLVLVGRAR